MYVFPIGLGVCFFTKRVHVLVKDFKDYQSLLSCRDFNVFYLFISKTIKVFCLAETSMSFAFTFQRLSKSFVLQRLQCLLPLLFKDYQSLLSCRDFNVFYLYISKTIKVFCLVETSMSSAFTFQRLSKSFVLQRLQCLMPLQFKDYQSILSCKDFNIICLYISKTINVFFLVETSMSSAFTFQRLLKSKDFNVFFTFQRLLMSFVKTSMSSAFTFQKLSMSFVKTSMSSLYFKTSMSFVKTSTSSLHFKDYQCLLSRLQCLLTLHFKEYQCPLSRLQRLLYVSKTIRVFCQGFNVFFTFQRLQYLFLRLQRLLNILRLQSLLFGALDTLYIYSFDRFHCFGFR